MVTHLAVDSKISPKGTVSLPRSVLEEVGWRDGDTIKVESAEGRRIVLSLQPSDVVDRTARVLTHLFPEPGDIHRFLDEERAAWGDFDRRFDG